MNFAKRRKSSIKTGRRPVFGWGAVMAACLLCVGGFPSGAYAQGAAPGLNTPQKQTITFMFALGNAEFNQKYGQNAASMTKFGDLIRQLTDAPSARIDSIVITSYSSTADQIGNAELAAQRVAAVRNYVDPVIRQSQLRQSVVVTGNVVARNNVFQPDQIFDMLKKTTVTVYLNGLSLAKAGKSDRMVASSAEEVERYVSPFGTETDVFGRRPVKQQKAEQLKAEVIAPVQQLQQPVVIEAPVVTENNTDANKELRRYIDSLTVSTNLPQPVNSQIEEEPCPQDRDPAIDSLVARLLAEQPTVLPKAPMVTGSATASGEVSEKSTGVIEFSIAEAPVAATNTKEAAKTTTGNVANDSAWDDNVIPFPNLSDNMISDGKKFKIKEMRESKVKAVNVPRVPMVLVHPFMGIKTNLAYWAAVAANLEVEFYFARKWSAAVEGVYTNWDMNLYKKNYAVNEISPEIRFWTSRKIGQYRGFYVGVYGHMGQFDIMFQNKETGYTGDYYGGGVSIGGYLPFTPHFGMELGLRGGYVNAKYDTYYYDAPNYMHKCSKTTGYLGLTGAKVSLVYRFGLRGANRK